MEGNVEIICIGNELLTGKVLNTNAHWLAKRVTSLGMIVKRMTVAGDNVSEIVSVVREALRRKPQFIITTGGLGPTFDDKTLEGIAKALNREWEIDYTALEMVRHKYETFAKKRKIERFELTPPRFKMAKFPRDTKPLPNPVGTAPAMITNVKETALIALPGVPSEMEAIFEESIAQRLREAAGRAMFYEKSTFADGIMESRIAPLIDQVMRDNARVYIKSHPHGEERKPHLELHFSTRAETAKAGRSCISKAMSQLEGLIRKNGGKVKTVWEENRVANRPHENNNE